MIDKATNTEMEKKRSAASGALAMLYDSTVLNLGNMARIRCREKKSPKVKVRALD